MEAHHEATRHALHLSLLGIILLVLGLIAAPRLLSRDPPVEHSPRVYQLPPITISAP